jgi:hypothetical protein
MTILDNSAPDLIFYYSTSKKYNVATVTSLDTSILQTRNGDLFADENLSTIIGKMAASSIIYDVKNPNNGLYERTGDESFFLPQGSIAVSLSNRVFKTTEGSFISPVGTNIYKILGGTGDFLNSTGFLVSVSKNDTIRELLMYFDK